MNKYCQTVYKKRKITENEIKTATICQRENPFYVNTVLAFRDRRYEYKRAVKTWVKKANALKGKNMVEYEAAKSKIVLYDSLQLAHKCILNSFYGYVMRKGARWQSMEMAGVVTRTGGNIIKEARMLIDQIGKPLELDTDGIWCILPSSFPENFQFKKKKEFGGGTYTISYPCVMLNIDVNKNYTNDQYQTLASGSEGVGAMKKFTVRSECSIFFEVDGPYRGMILPASTEEGRLLKKRYAVFNMNGTLAELKGFELKRRGELQVIKTFQSQVFEKFLVGDSLENCYKSVANVANFWLDVLYSQGEDMEDEEVIALISEKKNLSRALSDYGAQKSRAITTARRLADLLGPEMVKDPGLNCNMVIARLPAGGSITERSIPTIIFEVADMNKRRRFLRRWLKDPGLQDIDIRSILDWDYYVERFSDCVRKIITIPAALQNVPNPVDRVPHPDWLKRFVRERNDPFKQQKISSMFKPLQKGEMYKIASKPKESKSSGADIEDMFDPAAQIKEAQKQPIRPSPRSWAPAPTPKPKPKKRRGKSAWTMFVSEQMKCIKVEGGGNKMKAVSAAWKALTKEERRKYEDIAKEFNAKQAEEDRLKEEQERLQAEAAGPVKRTKDSDAAAEAPKRGRVDGAEHPRGTESWLQTRKRSWKRQRDARASRESDAIDDVYGASEHTGYDEEDAAETKRRRQATNAGLLKKGLGTFLKAQSQSITFGYWQIVSVAETRTPGDLKLFVLTSPTTMQTVTVRIPRVVYVNARSERADLDVGEVSLVDKVLPRASPAHHLLELTLPEPDFKRRSKKLDTFLTASNVEGVYESQVPSIFKCIVTLGCVTRVRPQMRKKLANQRVFSLEHLEFLKTKTYSYMAAKSAAFKRAYVYQSGSGNRCVWAFFTLGGTNATDDRTATCSLCFVTPKGSTVSPPDVHSMYADLAESYIENMSACADEGVDVVPPRSCAFDEHEIVHSLEEGNALVRGWFDKFHRQCRGAPAIVVFQSGGMSAAELRQLVPMIENNLPVVQLSCNESDNRYPALGWENFVLERVCQRSLAVEEWLKSRLERARYAHVPMGNLSNDPSSEMADVLYSRLLWTNKHLLWMSPGALPDLGGREFDEVVVSQSLVSSSADPEVHEVHGSSAFDQAENPNYCVPGMYRTICVELSIKNLAVNTLLKASLIAQMEGSDSSLALDMLQKNADDTEAGGSGMDGVEFLDESAACGTAFRVLRVLANKWFRDVAVAGDQVADTLLLNIYRWLCSPSSKLYEPAIHSMLNRLMRKLFLQLLAELRRLGSTVVHATFNKIIICTNKMTLDHAESYVNYVVQTLKARDLFEWVVAEPQTFWGQFLFMNGCNFGGVKITTGLEPESYTDMDVEDEFAGASSQISQIISHWNIAEYLTPHAKEVFEIAIGEIIDRPFQFQQKQVAKLMDSCITIQDDGGEDDVNEAETMEIESEEVDKDKPSASLTSTQIVEAVRAKARSVVRDFLTPTLLRFVPEIEREDAKDSFPQLAGSYRDMGACCREMCCSSHVVG